MRRRDARSLRSSGARWRRGSAWLLRGPDPPRMTAPTALPRALGARAFTIGNDIYFQAGAFEPTNLEARRLFATARAHDPAGAGRRARAEADREARARVDDRSPGRGAPGERCRRLALSGKRFESGRMRTAAAGQPAHSLTRVPAGSTRSQATGRRTRPRIRSSRGSRSMSFTRYAAAAPAGGHARAPSLPARGRHPRRGDRPRAGDADARSA